jgi:flagellar motor switch protein FliG
MSHPTSIRKAAILVSLLDMPSADALLDSMGEELAARVRDAVIQLDDVSDAEQHEVLAEFFGHGGSAAEGGVELQISAAPICAPAADDRDSLAFLEHVAPHHLADVLAGEHSQTIAVVIAHLSPEHAGRVLERLPPELATEALSRMAWLSSPAPEALADLASELRRRLAPYTQSASGKSGLESVRAILSSLPGKRRAELVERLAQQDEQLARGLDAPSIATSQHSVAEQIVSYRYRLAPAGKPSTLDRGNALESRAWIEFEDLSLLSDRDLAALAHAADDRWLALALIDADENLAERMLRPLSPPLAEELRHRLSDPGPIRLKEIDQAQRQIVELAIHLSRTGQISLPPSRHFAAAA